MKLNFHQTNTGDIAELRPEQRLTSDQDFIDLIGNVHFSGLEKVIVHSESLPLKFWNLKSKFAGNVLQKFSNYRQKLFIVGDILNVESKSLQDFIRESNKLGN